MSLKSQRKLWIDDIRDAPDKSWTVVRTVTEAIRMIAKFRWDVISLDHDISHYEKVGKEGWEDVDQEVRACGETFQPVAYFLGEKYWISRKMSDVDKLLAGGGISDESVHLARPLAGPRIVIHSANPEGAREMQLILKDYGLEAPYEPIMGEIPK